MGKGLELLKTYEDKYTFASQFNGDRLPDYQTRKMLEPIEKELKERENLATMCDELAELVGLKDKDYLVLKEVIKKALEKGKEDEKMVGIFKNALTIEHHDLPMVDPHDDSEDFVTYAFKTLTTIRQNELDKDLRQALREWVLKNAFPKELTALEILKPHIIKISGMNVYDKDFYECFLQIGNQRIFISKEQYDLLREVLVCH